MGLTVHYKLRLVHGTARQARAIIKKLHRKALSLPFARVTDFAEYSNRGGYLRDLPDWFRAEIEFWALPRRGLVIVPQRVFGFLVVPGRGCESATFGLLQYPKVFARAGGRRVPTRLSGWRWQAFCKTEYASNPRYGGVANFLRSHVALIALLDEAAKIGLKTKILDEGGYATGRDVGQLALAVADWNEMIAGIVGVMKDALPGGEHDAPITRYPDFEHLEARGRAKNGRLASEW